jgi:putative tributyrin esterase
VVKIVKDILQSSLMQRELPFLVILPEHYEVSKVNYPVLYLLHGLFGSCDNWLELTEIANYLVDTEFVVVLPEGGNNWYSDSATIATDKFESSFINELIPAVEANYRISARRETRAIAGLSMGGFGALKFALKRPELFIFAGSMSGAFNAAHLTGIEENSDWQELYPSVLEVFGQVNSPLRIENDLFKIIREMPEEKKSSVPFIYFDCGTHDSFLKVNREFAELLKASNIAFRFDEVAGGHDWLYWDKQTRVILKFVEDLFSRKNSSQSLKL